MDDREKEKMIYGIPAEHDVAACNALKEYERQWAKYEQDKHIGLVDKHPDMKKIAKEFNTTIEAMKEHRQCLDTPETEKA